jgi:hypothetical protein
MRRFPLIAKAAWLVMLGAMAGVYGACHPEQAQLAETQAEVFELKKALMVMQYSQSQLAADLIDAEAMAQRCMQHTAAAGGPVSAGASQAELTAPLAASATAAVLPASLMQ